MQRIPKFDSLRKPIIVTMGLPCTRKSVLAEKISDWVDCPVLFIDDFIEGDDIAAGSWEEAERLRANVLQRSFTTLCRVAERLYSLRRSCAVVIKSRLCSTFELQQLMQVAAGDWRFQERIVLIVECRVRNKHQWRHQFNAQYYDNDEYQYLRKWYRPRSWIDIEKAIPDHFDPQVRADWDLHLLHLKERYPDTLFRRLVVDPFHDLDLSIPECELNPVFCHAINYLFSKELNGQDLYVMEFDKFRQSRAEQILKALPSTRSKDVCGAQGCLFRSWEQLPTLAITASSLCGVCGEALVTGDPAYTCYYCILALHKSCAEMIHFNFLNICDDIDMVIGYIRKSEEKVVCKACTEKGLPFFDQFCDACVFQTLLKGRLVPLVVNHDHHPHPLSLRIQRKYFVCKACGTFSWDSSYVCSICEWSYHIQCVFMPREVEHHGHGGHDHVLKLKYKQDDTEEEDYWCDVCYRDLDPYFWFYSCQSCPSYAAHLYCSRVYPRRLWESCRLEDWRRT